VQSNSAIDRLARHMRGGSSPAWTPRQPQMSMHQGTLSNVDLGRGVVDFEFPDQGGLVVPQVRYLQPYTDLNPPTAGDVVWAGHFGADLIVFGRHYIPTGTIVSM
jgi:hypothetical protein